MSTKTLPTFDELMDPSLQALKRLGGSASIDELGTEIIELLDLPQEVVDEPHGTTSKTELVVPVGLGSDLPPQSGTHRELRARYLGSHTGRHVFI